MYESKVRLWFYKFNDGHTYIHEEEMRRRCSVQTADVTDQVNEKHLKKLMV